jgi:hypothetical protein
MNVHRRWAAAVVVCAAGGAASGQCVLSQAGRLGAFDGRASDRFGAAAAADGDRIVIGAPDDVDVVTNAGTAHVFRRVNGRWCPEARLVPDGAAVLRRFGTGVAISGARVLVGAPDETVSGLSQAGAAYAFVFDGVAWTQQARLTAPAPSGLAAFGGAVAIDGDAAIIGAPNEGMFTGAAYFFRWNGAAWVSEGRVAAPPGDGGIGHQFGGAVAVRGGRAAIGAINARNAMSVASGAVYVHEFNGASWPFTVKLTASDGAASDRFGRSVSLGVDRLLVGAPEDDLAAGANAGSAYVFDLAGMGWTQTAKLASSLGAAGDLLGTSVSLSGDAALVGAPGDDAPAGADAGSAAVFRRESGVWAERAPIAASDAAAGDGFGTAVALAGSIAGIGAVGDDDAGADAGSAYAFDAPSVLIEDQQPPAGTELVVRRGMPAVFVVRAATGGAPTFQWHRDGGPIVDGPSPGGGTIRGATTACLTIAPAGAADSAAGIFCTVTDGCLAASTQPVSLLVVPPDCPGDASGDGVVNFADVTSVLANFSLPCP